MQEPFWLLTISKTDFHSVLPLFPIYPWKDLCHLYIIYYGRISYGCINVSRSLLLLFVNILYLDLLKLKQWICKLCPEIDIDRLEDMSILFHSCMVFCIWSIIFYWFLVFLDDNAGDVFWTRVANFHCIFVEYLVHFLRFWEVVVQ